jgi:hypothetical protein
VLSFPVLAATHPCLSDPNPPLCVLGALCGETPSCQSLSLFPRVSSLTCPARSACPDLVGDLVGNALGKRLAVTYLESTLVEVLILNNFKPSRMNTYEKYRGEGVLLLTRHPMKDVCPACPDPVGERPSEARDLSRNPAGDPYQACLLRTSRGVNSAPYFQLSTFDFQPLLRALPFASHCRSARIRDVYHAS